MTIALLLFIAPVLTENRHGVPRPQGGAPAARVFSQYQDKHKEPVKGPPWTTDYKAARREALRTGKPIFSYTTKTV
jgi:hypothetical protein